MQQVNNFKLMLLTLLNIDDIIIKMPLIWHSEAGKDALRIR